MKGGVKNSRGLSTIVSTLMIVLLVFVAIGIVWVVVRNLVTGGSDQLDLTSKCLEATVSPTKVMYSGGIYNVTLLRSGGSDEIGGIKLIFSSEESEENYIHDESGNIEPLGVKTISVPVEGVPSPDKVEVVVYFLDNSGNEQLCQGSESFTISS